MIALPGYEITVEEVEEDEKVCLSARSPCTCVGTQLLGFEQACLSTGAHAGTKWLLTPQMSSVQPKAAVEFDQAINYVNKIKVHIPVRSQRLLRPQPVTSKADLCRHCR